MYKSVLTGTDGSETAQAAVEAALELAERFGSVVHVVNVVRPLPAGAEVTVVYPAGLEDAATVLAEEVAGRAAERGLEAHTCVLMGDPVERITAYAQEHGIELIVVGSKGMRGLRRLLGSIPNGIAHKASCAVHIVKTT